MGDSALYWISVPFLLLMTLPAISMPVTRKNPIRAKMIAEPSIGSTWLAYLRIVESKMC